MRKPNPESAPVPIPLVVLNVHEDGTVAVTVDGSQLDPDPPTVPWRRSSFGQIIDRATHERTTPARVEVHEADGTTFIDIIAPLRRRPARPQPAPEPTSLPVFHTVTGEGFVPGEDVAVAVVTGLDAVDRWLAELEHDHAAES